MVLAGATGMHGTAEVGNPERLVTMQDLIDGGIPIHGIDGFNLADVYVRVDAEIQEQVWERLAQKGKPLPAARILIGNVIITEYDSNGVDCPYCSLPEGYDACPVHRGGVPPTHPTPSR